MLKPFLFSLYYAYLKTLSVEEKPFHFSTQEVPFNLLKFSKEDALLILPLFAFKKRPILLPESYCHSFLHYAACQLSYKAFFYSHKGFPPGLIQQNTGLFLGVFTQKKEEESLSLLGFSEFKLSLSYKKGSCFFSYSFPLPYSLAIFSYQAVPSKNDLLSP